MGDQKNYFYDLPNDLIEKIETINKIDLEKQLKNNSKFNHVHL